MDFPLVGFFPEGHSLTFRLGFWLDLDCPHGLPPRSFARDSLLLGNCECSFLQDIPPFWAVCGDFAFPLVFLLISPHWISGHWFVNRKVGGVPPFGLMVFFCCDSTLQFIFFFVVTSWVLRPCFGLWVQVIVFTKVLQGITPYFNVGILVFLYWVFALQFVFVFNPFRVLGHWFSIWFPFYFGGFFCDCLRKNYLRDFPLLDCWFSVYYRSGFWIHLVFFLFIYFFVLGHCFIVWKRVYTEDIFCSFSPQKFCKGFPSFEMMFFLFLYFFLS